MITVYSRRNKFEIFFIFFIIVSVYFEMIESLELLVGVSMVNGCHFPCYEFEL